MEVVRPGEYIALRTPSDLHKVVQIQPNKTISLGKYGEFPSNQLLGRPLYTTYEILEDAGSPAPRLRIVPPTEQYEHIQDHASEGEEEPETNAPANGFSTPAPAASTPANGTRIPTDVNTNAVADARAAFTRAKYDLKRAKRTTKSFMVLPIDATLLARWFLYEKEPLRTMELREEILALLLSWGNVHSGGYSSSSPASVQATGDDNRWLVVDETGGLVVGAMAERMGLIGRGVATGPSSPPPRSTEGPSVSYSSPFTPAEAQERFGFARSNTITLVHANKEPNLSLLSYLGYDVSQPNEAHPLFAHLQTMSWLQLLSPSEDSLYREPDRMTEAELAALRATRRGVYYRKRRRWERIRGNVDSARAGGFAGLVVASYMQPVELLKHLVPLLRGGAQVVVYAPTPEALIVLQDLYAPARRAAFRSRYYDNTGGDPDDDDFPVDPTLLAGTTLHTMRARPWQVLPGRTHPVMMDRGGADGCLFVGTRVLPAAGRLNARGTVTRAKKRRVEGEAEAKPGLDAAVKIDLDAGKHADGLSLVVSETVNHA